MARIDALIATQVGDTTRPIQSNLEANEQANEARRKDETGVGKDALSATPAKPEEVKAAAERMQHVIETATGRQLDFALNERFKELIVRVSDRKSGEVIKEVPSKEFMQLRERLNDLIGLFIDEKA